LCPDRESDDLLAHFGDAYFIGRHQWDPTPRFLQMQQGAQAGSWRTHARHLTAAAEFRERFMRPEGWDNYAELYFWHEGKFEASICIRRAHGHPDFSPGELRLLKRLHGQLRGAIHHLGRTLAEKHELQCLRLLVARCPMPVMLLSESYAPVILNRSAQGQCMAWNHGPGASQHLKPTKHPPVHPAIATACRMLNSGRRCGEVRRLVHPHHPGLSAVVENLACGRAATPAFAVWFSESHAPRIDLAWRALLSPSEWEVALQVSTGATNREVAGRLGKSVATIRVQLHAAFRKLGVHSRMALAARLHSSSVRPAAGAAPQD
jgi:DNA-binding CsgD family transcriptional regulator